MPNYWLFKTEPNVFSIQDLSKAPKKTTSWEGVRNYQARNMLRDEVKKGDHVFFYHSNVQPVGIAGTSIVTKAGYPDPHQYDKKSKYFDPKANKDNPRWYLVDIKLDRIFKNPVLLQELRNIKDLQEMKLLQKGQRLSIQPVDKKHWDLIIKLT